MADKEKNVKITFLPSGETVEVDLNAMPFKHHGEPGSFLDVALNTSLHLEHACGGSCACTTCHIVVKKGEELLSEPTDAELDRLETAADLQLASRLGCQAVIERPGEIVVEIPSWNRNYISEGGASTLVGSANDKKSE